MLKKSGNIVGIVAICLLMTAVLSGCSLTREKSGELLPHLIPLSQAETDPVRPVDSFAATQGFTASTQKGQAEELLQILYSGRRPDFSTLPASSPVKRVYDEAVAVLDRYIRNDFTPFERIHAMHDWLAYSIAYDFALAEQGDSANPNHASFGLEGVFLQRTAVCDGFAKAMSLLCGIEGIRCIRITGTYLDEGEEINHAWNKVELDGVWYNVDTTMDNWHVYTDASTRVDIFNHGYFLVSDAALEDSVTGRHWAHESDSDNGINTPNYACPKNYEYHKNERLGIGDHAMEVTDQAALNDIFTRIKKQNGKIGRLELKLAFTDYDESNLSRADAYALQIEEAYKKTNADFRMDAAKGIYPYQRYPNGVFVFLIYK